MTQRIKELREYIVSKKHYEFRQEKEIDVTQFRQGDYHLRAAKRLKASLEAQEIVFLPNERIVATKTCKNLPRYCSDDEIDNLRNQYAVLWDVHNITPDYCRLIGKGTDKVIEEINQLKLKNPDSTNFYDGCIMSLEAINGFAFRYKQKAVQLGLTDIAKNLENIPRKKATSFYEALQFFRFIHFALWCQSAHVTIGRFDQYMYGYLKNDMDNGVLDYDSALEFVEDFFLSFNKDVDYYSGVQRGDNGQSMVLGGYDKDGNDMYNILSEMCMTASLELKVIDPKINLRVNKNTPKERYEFASKLTATGFGFPQYSNDDVVVKGLVDLGYDINDALNYTVAACWEFIIPGKGMEIPNIAALYFVRCVDDVVRKMGKGKVYQNFDEFNDAVCDQIKQTVLDTIAGYSSVYLYPDPMMSILNENTLESGKDISEGCKYNNFGMHGAGIANSADYAVAVKKLVFEGKMDGVTLNDMLDKDYVGYEDSYNKIIKDFPKMGNDDDEVDTIAVRFMKTFSDALKGLTNCHGGIWRAGTGSALLYITNDLRATADGRRNSEPLPANYSPSLSAKPNGPFSIIKSFTKPNLSGCINGGPLTLEFTGASFNNQYEKIGMLVKSFIDLGGHQIQLNIINKDNLIKAQKNPEAYRNLAVRVWGWTGYFTELDKIYQDQIIKRTDYSL